MRLGTVCVAAVVYGSTGCFTASGDDSAGPQGSVARSDGGASTRADAQAADGASAATESDTGPGRPDSATDAARADSGGEPAPDAGAPEAGLDLDAARSADTGSLDAGGPNPDDATTPACGSRRVLFLFDVSGSMMETWGTSTRLAVAQSIVQSAISAHAASLTAGALFFPTAACVPFLPPPQGGAVFPISEAPQVDFRAGPQFLQAFVDFFATTDVSVGIGTPLQEALDRADVALSSSSVPTTVVLISDGEGNCMTDPALTGIPTELPANHVASWAAAGIETFVLWFDPATQPTEIQDIATASGNAIVTPDEATSGAWLAEQLGCP